MCGSNFAIASYTARLTSRVDVRRWQILSPSRDLPYTLSYSSARSRLSPTKYSMTLCDDVHGVINIAKKEFPTVEKAIAHAINYNFLSHKWLIKEI